MSPDPSSSRGPSPFPTLTDDGGTPPGVMLLKTTSAPPVVLIRLMVGWVFLWAGLLKFIDPATYGAGAFESWGFMFPDLLGPLVGAFEAGCGMLVLFGIGVRVAVVPLIGIILVALLRVKLPLIGPDGLLAAIEASHLDVAMLCGCGYLLWVGAGPLSLDHRIATTPEE